MDTKGLYSYSLSKVRELFLSDETINMGDDFILAHRTNRNNIKLLKYPSRVDAYTALFCRKGHFKCSINLNEYEINEGMLVVNLPDNIIRIESFDDSDDDPISLIIISVSQQFMSNYRTDISKMLTEALVFLDNPCFEMDESERRLCVQYLNLMDEVRKSETIYAHESLKHLVSSLFYLFGSFLNKRMAAKEADKDASSRHKYIFEQFIGLVKQYHNKERSVGFYADKICLTPKYLSKIVKSVSGLSAPQWIDQYVLLEAEQLLKYSDMGIKEIADQLNFQSLSFFFKFFKKHTGCTPSQYRES